jgi:NAD(P)-dependent dehydrogenase (short-subunit alcohol dehydrogenase family)
MISSNELLLTDKVAVITGGASGIGGGIARGFADVGANVVIADINMETAEQTAAYVRSRGREVVVVKCDVMHGEQIREMVAKAKAQLGRIDILVNNVAGIRPTKFLEQSERSLQRHLDINLMSYLSTTRAVAAEMVAGGRGGNIINITSIEGTRAAPMFAVYAAAKAAMISLTRTLSLELAEHNIRVNAIAPDICDTPGLRASGPHFFTPAAIEARTRYVPLRRDGTVDDIAKAAIFLASPFSSYITGIVLNVDGGTRASSGWTRSTDGGWTLFER